MLFPQQVFIISHCFALVNTFFKTFFRPPGPNPCFAFSVPPSRDSLDIISHRLAFVNTFFENFFQAARPDRRFLLSCCLSRNNLVIIPHPFPYVNSFLQKNCAKLTFLSFLPLYRERYLLYINYISSSVGFCYRNGREIQISLLLFFKTVVY